MHAASSRQVDIAKIALTEDEVEAAVAVLRSGALRQGKQCERFEDEFAARAGAKFAVCSANGSASLHLAYMTFLEPGDEVLVPSFTFIATGSMVWAAGGRPVFCDVDPKTWLIDLEDARARITERTRAISPVHLFGASCDVDEIAAFARRHGLKIIWDAAQAHGATWRGDDVGGFDDFVSYSFYPSKNMFVGEGGMTLTNDADAAQRMRHLRSHGETGRYLSTMLGYNYRMTDVEAAIGRKQLERLDEMLEIRRKNRAFLLEGLSRFNGIEPQALPPGSGHAVHQFCATIDAAKLGLDRDELARGLGALGVATGVHYPRGLHQQPAFVDLYGHSTLPVTEALCRTILAFPVHHGLTNSDLEYVVEAVGRCVEANAAKRPVLARGDA
jgi:perosamine synthetase